MAGCCVILLSPIILALSAVALAIFVGMLFAGLTFITIGAISKIKLKNTKYNFISNICIVIGISIFWLMLSVKFPILAACIIFGIGIFLIKKNDEWNVLKYYIPAMLILVVLALPKLQFLTTHPILMIILFAIIVFGYIVGFIYLLGKGRIQKDKPILIKECYSTIFYSEAVISILFYFTKIYIETGLY